MIRTIIHGDGEYVKTIANERTFITGNAHVATELKPGVWEIKRFVE